MLNGSPSPDDRSTVPGVWVLIGHKTGDNEQVLALAEALGWAFESKRFAYARWEVVPNLAMRATLAGVAKRRSSSLGPPWPDLVITAGRRNEPIALWIQKAAAADGRRVRLVHLGRPWNRLDRFDLIVTTPQYSLPERANILLNQTPLHRVTAGRLREAAAQWAERFANLPRPRVAVLIGGSIAPHSYDDASAERLAKQASSLAAASGGSLLVSTSARTPPPTIDTLCDHITAPSYVFRWQKGAAENPYFGMLALADAFVVTADSMSMLTEACATGKPVHIFDLGEGEHAMRPEATRPAGVGAGVRRTLSQRLTRRFHLLVKMLTPQQLGRDIGIIHQQLVDAGAAVWLGDPVPADGRAVRLDGVARAVARVRALCDLPADPAARAGHIGRGPLGTDEACK
jgi:mitochondrial fission protein ELM1